LSWWVVRCSSWRCNGRARPTFGNLRTSWHLLSLASLSSSSSVCMNGAYRVFPSSLCAYSATCSWSLATSSMSQTARSTTCRSFVRSSRQFEGRLTLSRPSAIFSSPEGRRARPVRPSYAAADYHDGIHERGRRICHLQDGQLQGQHRRGLGLLNCLAWADVDIGRALKHGHDCRVPGLGRRGIWAERADDRGGHSGFG
jgi:hypothetical protein